MKLKKLVALVRNWSSVRGILDQSTVEKQVDKFTEEFGEFFTAKTDKERMDAIGDSVITLINANFLLVCKREFDYITERHKRTTFSSKIESMMCISDDVEDLEIAGAVNGLWMLARTFGYNFEECLQMAWDEIKDRKGMMVDGLYVKWDDLTQDQREELDKRMIEDTILKR